MREWHRLRRWLDKDRQFLTWQQELERQRQRWEEDSAEGGVRDTGKLLRGGDLDTALQFQHESDARLTDEQRAFIAASEDEQRRSQRLRRYAVAGLAILTVVALVAAVIALLGFVRANNETARAQANARHAIALRLVPEATEMLARRRPGGDVQALQELLAADALSPDDAVVKGGLLDAMTQRQSTFKVTDTDDEVDTVAFSLDGHRLASSRTLGDTVRLWDADTGQGIGAPLKTDSGLAGALALSPDGHRLAAGDENGHLLLWNTEREAIRAPLILPAAHKSTAVWAVAFSRDGQRLPPRATTAWWDSGTPRPGSRYARRQSPGSIRGWGTRPLARTLTASRRRTPTMAIQCGCGMPLRGNPSAHP